MDKKNIRFSVGGLLLLIGVLWNLISNIFALIRTLSLYMDIYGSGFWSDGRGISLLLPYLFSFLLSTLPILLLSILMLGKKVGTPITVMLTIKLVLDLISGIASGISYLHRGMFLMPLANFVLLLSTGCLLMLSIVSRSPNPSGLKKLWFLPGCLEILFSICILIANITSALDAGILSAATVLPQLPAHILNIAAYFLAGRWLAYPFVTTSKAHAQYSANYAGSTGRTQDDENSHQFNLALHIVLLIVTAGIWQFIWIYKTTRYLNRTPGAEFRNPTNKLLLCMFVPFYFIYWVYQSAQRIDKLAASRGIHSDISTLCLVLSLFVPIISLILMQDKINAIVGAASCQAPVQEAPQYSYQQPVQNPTQYAYQPTYQQPTQEAAQYGYQPTYQQPTQPASPSTAEELTRYKYLLDAGAITQEEYDAVKKRLLGL